MARTELMGIEQARKVLGKRADLAADKKDELHTLLTKHGQPHAAVVGMDWYVRAREALGDPTELHVAQDDDES